MTWLHRSVFILILTAGLAGCGGRTHPVSGRVVFKEDGKPAVGGTVEFEPLDSSAKVSAKGVIDGDGRFQLTTYSANDGAIVGEHRVLVIPSVLKPGVEERARTPRQTGIIHPKYMSYETSGLKVHVKAGRNNFILEVTRPAKGKLSSRSSPKG